MLEFIYNLKQNNGSMWVEADKLHMLIPESLRTEETRNFIQKNKEKFMHILQYNKIFSKRDFEWKDIFSTDDKKGRLSFAQERFWFFYKYEENSDLYHVYGVYEILENINLELLKNSLFNIIKRHKILRTVIKYIDEEDYPSQIIQENYSEIIQEKFLSNELNLEQINNIIKHDISHPFKLEYDFPIRITIYKYNHSVKKRNILIINIHHIVADGWSMELFQKELLQGYYSNSQNSFENESLNLEFKDYATWQRITLNPNNPLYKEQLLYWKNKLSGFQLLNFPTDYPRKNEIDYSGTDLMFSIPLELSKKVRNVSRSMCCTTYAILLSAFAILLSKYSNQNDIVIGIPIANRHHSEVGGIIGCFVNTQVQRIIIDDIYTFEQLINIVSKSQVESQLYQDMPFEKLVDELNIERSSAISPIFQIMFSVQRVINNFDIETTNENKSIVMKMSNLMVPYNFQNDKSAKFDLTLMLDDSIEEMIGVINYATSLFKPNTIERFKENYLNLLLQLVDNRSKKISEIVFLSKEDYKKLIYECNSTISSYSKDKRLHQLFEKQVEKSFDEIALVYAGQKLTYKELNEKANQLARYIRSEYNKRTKVELKVDTLIGLCLDRSLEMIIGILGILKAGGAYVPIDPNYPIDRIEYILEDTSAELILTQRQVLNKQKDNRLSNLLADKLRFIDLIEIFYQEEEISNLDIVGSHSDLAYVIYTSGTTGKPKGVMIEHGGIVSLLDTLLKKYKIKNNERFLLFANYVFDASVEQMNLSLVSGNTLHIVSDDMIQNTSLFVEYIVNYEITHLHATPSYLENIEVNAFMKLNRLIFGAEVLTRDIYKKVKMVQSIIYNEYGPTETTITTIVSNHYSYIGKPISNTKVYILDNMQQPLPVGVIGELYIGGAGVARGYLNREDLTLERFISNPYATEEDVRNGYTRLYKTGDLCRYLEDGNIEYIGRNDDQVKIRGYRIELGEIENALASISGIKQASVLVKTRELDSGINNKYIVGYYIKDVIVDSHSKSSTMLSEEELLYKLAEKLPEYMLPSYLIEMESFPLTINGKLDKKALPEPEHKVTASYIAPRTDLEIELTKIYASSLGLDVNTISINDDFFRIGGDSISSLTLLTRINKQLKTKLKVKDIFIHRNIYNLSNFISENQIYQNFNSSEVTKFSYYQEFIMRKTDSKQFKRNFILSTPNLDVDILQQSINLLFSYHHVLRGIKEFAESSNNKKHIFNEFSPDNNLLRNKAELNSQVFYTLDNLLKLNNIDNSTLKPCTFFYISNTSSSMLYCSIYGYLVDARSLGIIINDLQFIYQSLLTIDNSKLNFQDHQDYFEYAKKILDNKQNIDDKEKYEIVNDIIQFENNISNLNNHSYYVVNKFIDKITTEQLFLNLPQIYNCSVKEIIFTALASAINLYLHTSYLCVINDHWYKADNCNNTCHNNLSYNVAIYQLVLNYLPKETFSYNLNVIKSFLANNLDTIKVKGSSKYNAQNTIIINYYGEIDSFSYGNGFNILAKGLDLGDDTSFVIPEENINIIIYSINKQLFIKLNSQLNNQVIESISDNFINTINQLSFNSNKTFLNNFVHKYGNNQLKLLPYQRRYFNIGLNNPRSTLITGMFESKVEITNKLFEQIVIFLCKKHLYLNTKIDYNKQTIYIQEDANIVTETHNFIKKDEMLNFLNNYSNDFVLSDKEFGLIHSIIKKKHYLFFIFPHYLGDGRASYTITREIDMILSQKVPYFECDHYHIIKWLEYLNKSVITKEEYYKVILSQNYYLKYEPRVKFSEMSKVQFKYKKINLYNFIAIFFKVFSQKLNINEDIIFTFTFHGINYEFEKLKDSFSLLTNLEPIVLRKKLLNDNNLKNISTEIKEQINNAGLNNTAQFIRYMFNENNSKLTTKHLHDIFPKITINYIFDDEKNYIMKNLVKMSHDFINKYAVDSNLQNLLTIKLYETEEMSIADISFANIYNEDLITDILKKVKIIFDT